MFQLFILLLLLIFVGCQSPTKEIKQADEQIEQSVVAIHIPSESNTTILAELPVKPEIFRKSNTSSKPSLSRQEPLNSIDAVDFRQFSQTDNLRLHGIKAGPVVSVFQINTSPRLFIDFENDIFTNTDYYYTNGIRIGFSHPMLKKPADRLLPSASTNSLIEYGVSLTQKMYTGIDPETEITNFNDRPFAGTMIAEYSKTSIDFQRSNILYGSIQLGVIGKPSLASWVQQVLHEKFPSGWGGQIRTDLLLNYNLRIEHRIYQTKLSQIQLLTEARAGSYKTNAAAGFKITIGNQQPNPNAATVLHDYTLNQQLPIWFAAEAVSRFVIHDASLHGGLFNKTSPHILKRNETSTATFQLSLSTGIQLQQSSITLKVVYLSKEFKTGTDHRWGVISVSHNL